MAQEALVTSMAGASSQRDTSCSDPDVAPRSLDRHFRWP
jgi:hypothetical protein